MPEARYLEIVATQVAQAHYALLEVLIREHEAEPEVVRRSIAHEHDPPFPGQKNDMALRMTRRMDHRDPPSHRDLIPIAY